MSLDARFLHDWLETILTEYDNAITDPTEQEDET